MTAVTDTPTAQPNTQATRQINVRFDGPTRTALELVAAAQDRTLTQLVRYALIWWFTQPARTRWAGERGMGWSRVSGGRHVNVRLPLVLLNQLDGLDRSAAIRAAVRAWLNAGHPHAAEPHTVLRGAAVGG